MKKLKVIIPLSLLLVSVSVISVYGAGEGAAGTFDAAALARGYNDFGMGLFRMLSAGAADRNTFVSPVSVALCLGMAYNGADGKTYAEMGELLGSGSASLESYNEANRLLIDTLEGERPGGILSIANSLWLSRNFTFREDYIARNEKYFGAGSYELSGAAEINEWVSSRTENMIPTIIDSVDPYDIAILVNAIYFKGTWQVRFDPALTTEKEFFAPSGSIIVPMMVRSGDLICLENDVLQGVRLPYADGGISMVVLLPAEGEILSELVSGLDIEKWNSWTASMRTRDGTIELPRFRAEYFSDIAGDLSDLGMKAAFGKSADFSRMCKCSPGDVFISDVLHKAVVEVNEEGTEAAAATAVKLKMTSAMPVEERFHMVVDRPFLVAIVDDDTGLILFIGAINKPMKTER